MQKSSELRQFQIDRLIKAPLATFDTIDLGDELPKAAVGPSLKSDRPDLLSKKSPNKIPVDSNKQPQQGADKKEKKSENTAIKSQILGASKDESKSNADQSNKAQEGSPIKNIPSVNVPQPYRDRDNEEGFENYVYISHIPAADLKEKVVVVGTKKPSESQSVEEGRVQASSQPITKIEPPPAPTLSRSSSSFSSSSDSESESDVRRRSIKSRRPFRVRTYAPTNRINDSSPVTLSPEIVDPSTITSPSKRKAYEKRLQRLQVKTSPIARPRSTTPINVVTLDEYVVLSSPEKSPNSPSIAEKLKITLPADEFCVKPRSPRKSQLAKKYSEDECCFEFNEELLFSHTRSALLVTGDGKVPDSPRRVLIPPTISPSSSPKLAPAAKLGKDFDGVGSTELVYIQSPDNENWATFPEIVNTTVAETDSSQTFEDAAKTEHVACYANETVINSCDINTEEEEILTVNIDTSSGGKCGIDITLSSSGSSNIPSPSTPDKAPASAVDTHDEESVSKGTPPITITASPTKEEELVEQVLSSSPRETYL